MTEIDPHPPQECTMARFTIASARRGIDLIKETGPQATTALFLGMGLITNTRAIFHALVNRDSKRSQHHTEVITSWLRTGSPRLARFRALIVSARNQFIKEFSVTPLVVRTHSNFGPSSYDMPLYIPMTPEIEGVLTEDEREYRSKVQRDEANLPMRINLLPECEGALNIWDDELNTLEADILARLNSSRT